MLVTTFKPGFHVVKNKSLLDQALQDFLQPAVNGYVLQTPGVNIRKQENSFVLELAVPGLQRDQIAIQLEDNVLKVSGQAEAKEKSAYNRLGFDYSQFEKQFQLNDKIDGTAAKAKLDSGILYLELPLKPEVKPRTVEIE